MRNLLTLWCIVLSLAFTFYKILKVFRCTKKKFFVCRKDVTWFLQTWKTNTQTKEKTVSSVSFSLKSDKRFCFQNFSVKIFTWILTKTDTFTLSWRIPLYRLVISSKFCGINFSSFSQYTQYESTGTSMSISINLWTLMESKC